MYYFCAENLANNVKFVLALPKWFHVWKSGIELYICLSFIYLQAIPEQCTNFDQGKYLNKLFSKSSAVVCCTITIIFSSLSRHLWRSALKRKKLNPLLCFNNNVFVKILYETDTGNAIPHIRTCVTKRFSKFWHKRAIFYHSLKLDNWWKIHEYNTLY